MMLQFRIIWKRSIAIISDNIVKFTDYHTFILWLLYLSPVVPFVSVSSRDLKTRPSAGQTTLNITCWFRIYKDQTLPHYLILCVNFLYLSCFQTMFRNIIILGKFLRNSMQKVGDIKRDRNVANFRKIQQNFHRHKFEIEPLKIRQMAVKMW